VFGTRCSAVLTPGIAKIQNLFIRQIQLRIETTASCQQAKQLLHTHTEGVLCQYKGVAILWDVDPL